MKCKWLFISLGVLSFLHPFSRVLDWLIPIFEDLGGTLLYTGVMVSSVHALSDNRRHVILAFLLAVPALLLSWVGTFILVPSLKIAALVLFLLLIGYTAVRVLAYVFETKEIVQDKIFGALSVYLLLGHGWALVFIILEIAEPGSFAGLASPGQVQGLGSELIYHSFVNLTTLGYGDITPVTIIGRNLAAMEAVTGVLYTATLIGRLVGAYRGTGEGSG